MWCSRLSRSNEIKTRIGFCCVSLDSRKWCRADLDNGKKSTKQNYNISNYFVFSCEDFFSELLFRLWLQLLLSSFSSLPVFAFAQKLASLISSSTSLLPFWTTTAFFLGREAAHERDSLDFVTANRMNKHFVNRKKERHCHRLHLTSFVSIHSAVVAALISSSHVSCVVYCLGLLLVAF